MNNGNGKTDWTAAAAAGDGEPSGTPPDRLDGWKEIAAYLRRAPRTAQRWELHFGMPVHRIGGEVVYAYRSEIDAWAASDAGRPATAARAATNGDIGNGTDHGSEDGSTTDDGHGDRYRQGAVTVAGDHSRRWTWPLRRGWGAVAALCAVVAVAIALGFRALAPTPAIAAWRVGADQLYALDDRGSELWTYRLPTREVAADEGTGTALLDDGRRALIDDLDGDGRMELALVTRPADPKEPRLLVFNADGTLRFSHQRTGNVTFGDTVYHGPFGGAWVKVTQNADGSKALWYQSRHVPLFASVIEQFDAQGHLLADYWNGGVIAALATGTFGGRRLVFIGGDANEGNGAALAVFDEGRVGGGNVGGDFAHTCTSCGPVQAKAIFLFPRHELGRVNQNESTISLILVKDEAEIQVDVDYFGCAVPGTEGVRHAVAHFFFDASLNLTHAEHQSEYRFLHDFFWKQGRIDHPYGDADRAELSPIRRWTGGSAFEPMYAADSTAAGGNMVRPDQPRR